MVKCEECNRTKIVQVTTEELKEFIEWLEYELSITTEFDRKETFEDLENSTRIFHQKYAVILKKLGYKGMKDLHEDLHTPCGGS